LDGRSAIEQPRQEITPNLVLQYIPDGLSPKSGEPVAVSLCVYEARGSGGLYVFAEETRTAIKAEAYVEYLGFHAMFDMLRHLAEDPRLLSGPESASCDDTTLDLAEAEQLKATALRNYRENAWKVWEALKTKSDDWLWTYLRTRLKSDLEWLDMGSARHVLMLKRNAAEVFGIENPIQHVKFVDLENGPD
jgi:hypothetical protein